MNDTLEALSASVARLHPDLIALRRQVHAHPELSRQETHTTEVIGRLLREADIAVRTLPGTGLLADLGAEQAAYRVALRADLDALPIQERTDLPFASTLPGVAHACGHDVHVSALFGAMLALKQSEDLLRERGIAVRAIFQAAEETVPGGALDAIDAGALDGVDAIFAVHCDPSIDVGQVGLREGPITAACDQVRITLSGRGGHTSRPQLTQDLGFILGKVLTDVPAALSRRMDPRIGITLVWGMVHGGTAVNVIPSSAHCGGTLRMLDADAWRSVGPILDDLVEGVVAPYGADVEVDRSMGVPPVVNHPEAVKALRAACEGAGLSPVSTAQSLGGEDFAWYLHTVPGAMARLGTRTPGGHTYDLHQGDLIVDEDAIASGARLLACVVLAHTVKAGRHDSSSGGGAS